jgi:hypothetical protein
MPPVESAGCARWPYHSDSGVIIAQLEIVREADIPLQLLFLSTEAGKRRIRLLRRRSLDFADCVQLQSLTNAYERDYNCSSVLQIVSCCFVGIFPAKQSLLKAISHADRC